MVCGCWRKLWQRGNPSHDSFGMERHPELVSGSISDLRLCLTERGNLCGHSGKADTTVQAGWTLKQVQGGGDFRIERPCR